jgi:hypothetical protein
MGSVVELAFVMYSLVVTVVFPSLFCMNVVSGNKGYLASVIYV